MNRDKNKKSKDKSQPNKCDHRNRSDRNQGPLTERIFFCNDCGIEYERDVS